MWVDLLVDNLLTRFPGPHVINDAKTPSGHVTVAHLRGVLMHECIARALGDRKVETTFLYGFDDYERYLGMPLVSIPAPPGAGPANYGPSGPGEEPARSAASPTGTSSNYGRY